MTALSPGLSWLVFGGWLLAVVLIVAFFMGAGRKAREYEELHDYSSITWSPIDDANIRIIGGPYDAEERGDFD